MKDIQLRKQIDTAKKYTTLSGAYVRILTVNGSVPVYPVVGEVLEYKIWRYAAWTSCGLASPPIESFDDLVEITE